MMEDELMEEVMREHPEYRDFIAKHGPHAEMDGMSPMGHLHMHAIVERQLRSGEIPEMQMVLAKLMSQGMSRHDAIHRLATPLAETIYEVAKEKKPFNEDAYVRKILKLVR